MFQYTDPGDYEQVCRDAGLSVELAQIEAYGHAPQAS